MLPARRGPRIEAQRQLPGRRVRRSLLPALATIATAILLLRWEWIALGGMWLLTWGYAVVLVLAVVSILNLWVLRAIGQAYQRWQDRHTRR